MVVSPTRELAIQIADQCDILFRDTPFNYLCAYGGIDIQQNKDTARLYFHRSINGEKAQRAHGRQMQPSHAYKNMQLNSYQQGSECVTTCWLVHPPRGLLTRGQPYPNTWTSHRRGMGITCGIPEGTKQVVCGIPQGHQTDRSRRVAFPKGTKHVIASGIPA